MQVMKFMLYWLFIFLPFIGQAENAELPCENDFDSFFPYKAGIQAEQDNLTLEAFNIFCVLAFKGDYRAQFKLAQYYEKGIPGLIDSDFEFAYIWAALSNSQVVSKKRNDFIESIYNLISEERKQTVHLKYQRATQMIPSGFRIDMQYKAIDYQKLFELNKKRQEKKSVTGSHIKRDKPILNTQIFDF